MTPERREEWLWAGRLRFKRALLQSVRRLARDRPEKVADAAAAIGVPAEVIEAQLRGDMLASIYRLVDICRVLGGRPEVSILTFEREEA